MTIGDRASVEFTCAACGKFATRVIRAGAGVQIETPVIDIWTALDAARVDDVQAAIEAGDAATLFRAHRELVPFWCPACAATYCPDHWTWWEVFEEDWFFFDEARGTCPHGHERMLWD